MLQRFCGAVPLTVLAAAQPLVIDNDRLQIEQAVLYLLLHLLREMRAATLILRACACTLAGDMARRFGIAPGAYASITLGVPDYAPDHEFAGDPRDIAAPTRAADTAESEAGVPLGHGETILVVDDEQHIVTVAGLMQERLGYTPLLAQSAAEACQLMAQHRAEIKVAILDSRRLRRCRNRVARVARIGIEAE